MSNTTQEAALTDSSAQTAQPPVDKRLVRRAIRAVILAGAVVVVLVALRLWGSLAAKHRLETATQGNLAAQVVVVQPKVSSAVQQLVLPANVQAFVEAPIYARTNGYLKTWYFDIGAHVKAGDLLAEIETPEGDLQLAQARADLKALQANADLARRTAERWESLLKKNAVSKQETDQAISDLSAKQAAVDAGAANVRRLEQLQDYEKVYAPFDGVVTARDTDTGALIDAGSSPRPLFHLASVGKLRVFASVPEDVAAAVKEAGEVTLTSDQLPNRVFRGRIARDAESIDPVTRTLNIEVDIDNPNADLLPGSYGFVHIGIPAKQAPMTLPANTLLFRAQGLQVAVAREGRAVLVPVTIGHDFGESVEVTSGVTPADRVILDPPDSIAEGDPIEVSTAK